MSASADPHNRNRSPSQDEDEEDPVEAMISKTGCLEKHYAVQVSNVWCKVLVFMYVCFGVH